ncbi:similar to Saccharomyces cerevisiae YJR094C IME1 Master regulator of meiosis that is active only during meiotic events [Maudiozyma barnettii]|uniref:Similar to Saccharomyces cerevisiae YJR094C IME1 Master regulator of meiosis that is active only during meiotic events n=1 Tax=Maudiozyma barnettii TaxID=61262 RepID=A0A8H2ZKY9_9SACH|nr:transcription factor IME1 [Kazachstania barnettii]CAB4255637.1 similar to Saccharomyces cerevisiae YJR094C IME1 Master regulator of meiosis that is active only during meiotic events [Kazachstania barnettii]CAD1784198.1 similar to Saccharomyces cerevisiae YJR094C IME1 Master regulator of meiosis that is active only during meiotic events [Kazachstania barnettii]
MTDIFSIQNISTYPIPLIKSDYQNVINDDLLYQFDEDIDNFQSYHLSMNSNHNSNNNQEQNDLNTISKNNYENYSSIENENLINYHDILSIAIDGKKQLISDNNNNNNNLFNSYETKCYISTPLNQLHKRDNFDEENHYIYQQQQQNNINSYNNSNFPNNIPSISSDEEEEGDDLDIYSDVIHTIPIRTKHQVPILNTKCIYEEFLKDYDSVSTDNSCHSDPIHENFTTNTTFNNTINYGIACHEFPIKEITTASKNTHYLEKIPRLVPDIFPEISTTESKYFRNIQILENKNQNFQHPVAVDSFTNMTENEIYNDKTSNPTEFEFICKLQKKLYRYFSNADYLDKVRFQEISYRFSKTYY